MNHTVEINPIVKGLNQINLSKIRSWSSYIITWNGWLLIHLLPLARDGDHSSFIARFRPLKHEIEEKIPK